MPQTVDDDDLKDWLLRNAPSDVLSTVSQLEAAGYRRESATWGPDVPFGDAVMQFARSDTDVRVIIARDRLQWVLDFGLPDGGRFDLDVVSAVRRGESPWEDYDPRFDELPVQLPEGVIWAEEVPLSMEWLRSTPHVHAPLRAAQRARADAMFGPLSFGSPSTPPD